MRIATGIDQEIRGRRDAERITAQRLDLADERIAEFLPNASQELIELRRDLAEAGIRDDDRGAELTVRNPLDEVAEDPAFLASASHSDAEPTTVAPKLDDFIAMLHRGTHGGGIRWAGTQVYPLSRHPVHIADFGKCRRACKQENGRYNCELNGAAEGFHGLPTHAVRPISAETGRTLLALHATPTGMPELQSTGRKLCF